MNQRWASGHFCPPRSFRRPSSPEPLEGEETDVFAPCRRDATIESGRTLLSSALPSPCDALVVWIKPARAWCCEGGGRVFHEDGRVGWGTITTDTFHTVDVRALDLGRASSAAT